MQWTSFRDRLIPGQEEEWTLNILRPDGKAAAAQLMATMYDKSLDQLTNMNWSMNLNLFRGNAHTQWVKLINSFQNQFLSQNISNDLCVLYPDAFTSMGHIFCALERRKSIS